MKIGIIYTAYNCEEYLVKSLTPWAKARRTKLGGHEFIICAVSVPFKNFECPNPDATPSILAINAIEEFPAYTGFVDNDTFVHVTKPIKGPGAIDKAILEPKFIAETEARTLALDYLKSAGVDIVWQVDGDEFYTEEEIQKIIRFVEMQKFIPWFRIAYKNYIFDEKTYLTEPFTPARIHRIRLGNGLVATSFWDDNNILYQDSEVKTRDVQIASLTIPKALAWVKHLTWLSNDRSRQKVEYQLRRGWKCSYQWNYEKNCLEFNSEFYRVNKLALPEVKTE
jgi:hypothetical protein